MSNTSHAALSGDTTTTPTVKGVAVRAGLHWVSAHYGLGAVQAVHDQGSEALRRIIVPGLSSFGILSTGWYGVLVIGELLDVIVQATGPANVEAHFRRMASAVAHDNVTGVYKALFRLVATPALLTAHGGRVWRSYFSHGTIDVTSAREGELTLAIRDAGVHHATMCLMTSLVVERILVEVGYKGATLGRRRCTGRGDMECAFQIDYLA